METWRLGHHLYFFFMNLELKKNFFWLRYSLCTILYKSQEYSIVIHKFFKSYTPFIIIIKDGLYSLYHTLYPYSSFILYTVVWTSQSLTPGLPLPTFPLPTGLGNKPLVYTLYL